MELWIELVGICGEACNELDEALVASIYSYAQWCWKSPNSETRTAVVCAFFEHLPTTPSLRRDMIHRLDQKTFIELKGAFQYHLSSTEFQHLEHEFLEAKRQHRRS